MPLADIQTLAEQFPSPPALDDYLRRTWRVVPDPEEFEFIQSPELQIAQAKQNGFFFGDCDDSATLAAAVMAAGGWPCTLVALREPGKVEFSHVWLRCGMPDGGVYDIDPIVPRQHLPLSAYAELLEVKNGGSPMSYLQGMGEFCTTPMCASGKASVDQMLSVYEQLGRPQNFTVAVMGIKTAFDEAYSFYDVWIPFNPACCTVQQIGVQADVMTNEMLIAAGQEPIGPGPATKSPPGELPDIGGLGTLAAVLAAGLVVGLVLAKR